MHCYSVALTANRTLSARTSNNTAKTTKNAALRAKETGVLKLNI